MIQDDFLLVVIGKRLLIAIIFLAVHVAHDLVVAWSRLTFGWVDESPEDARNLDFV